MMADLTKLSDSDLDALVGGRLQDVSDAGLRLLAGRPETAKVVSQAVSNITNFPQQQSRFQLLEQAKQYQQPTLIAEGKDPMTELVRQLGLSVRAPIAGAGQLLGMVGDPIANLINALSGRQLATPPTQTVESLLERTGLPKAETPQERVVQDIAGALTGAAGTMRLGTQLARGAASPVTRGVGEMLAARPDIQAAAATGGAVGAGLAREEGLGPEAQLGAALIGSIAPGMPVAARVPVQAGVELVRPFTKTGQEVIAGNILRKFATTPDEAAARMVAAPEYVPGSVPTMAEASGDPGLLALQSVLGKTFDPTNLIGQRIAQQNIARQEALAKIAGEGPEAITAAKATRKAVATPMRTEAFLAQKEFGPLSYDATNPVKSKISSIIAGETGAQEPVEKSMDWVVKRLNRIEAGAQLTPERLYGLRKDIRNAIAGKYDDVDPSLRLAAKELAQVRDVLDNVIEQSAPGYKNYLAEYTALSQPVSSREMLQAIRDASRVAAPDISTGQTVPILSQAAMRRNVAARAEELGKTLTEEQAKVLDNVLRDLDRFAGQTSQVARRPGSDTFKNFSVANMIGAMFSESMLNNTTVKAVTAPMNFLYRIPDEQVSQLLVEASLDPKFAAMLMKQATQKNVEPVARALVKKAQEIGIAPAATGMPRE